MTRPLELASDARLKWSACRGTDLWELFCAAIAGDTPAIARLLDAEPELARSHYNYRTPIYFAVRENQLAAARLLLERGADPMSLAVGDTLLVIARDRGYREMEALLESNCDGVRGAPHQGNPVCAAIRGRDLANARKLLDAMPHLLHQGDESSNQPIHWAVMTRQIEMIDDLARRGADLNAARHDGARPIQLVNGDYHYRGWRDVPPGMPHSPGDVLRHLIAIGARVDVNTACHMGDTDRVRQLLDDDPALANRVSDYVTYYLGSGTPLRNAAAAGHIEVVRLLLERGADPNREEVGIAPHGHALYSAVYNGHSEIAELLLEHGAYPSPEVESSADAMSIALSRGDNKMVDLLASYGSSRSVELLAHYGDVRTAAAVFAANPALADDPGALGSAAGCGHIGFVRLMLRVQPHLARRCGIAGKTRVITELLFAAGMDANHTDWLGVTRLHELAGRGDIDNAALFLDRGASLTARDEVNCSTPLGWAAKCGQTEMVRFLLERGAPVELPDDPAWARPLAWAQRRGHTDIAELLWHKRST